GGARPGEAAGPVRRRCQPEVHRAVLAPLAAQGPGRRAAVGARVGILVVAARVLARHGEAVREAVEADLVRAVLELLEAVLALVVGRRGADRAARAVLQRHLDAPDAGLARVLQPVAVAVRPDEVADLR